MFEAFKSCFEPFRGAMLPKSLGEEQRAEERAFWAARRGGKSGRSSVVSSIFVDFSMVFKVFSAVFVVFFGVFHRLPPRFR